MNEIILFIPRNIKTKSEMFQGYGMREIKESMPGFIISLLIAMIAKTISKNDVVMVYALIPTVLATVFIHQRNFDKMSIYDIIKNKINFMKSQKFYPYIKLNPWEEEN